MQTFHYFVLMFALSWSYGVVPLAAAQPLIDFSKALIESDSKDPVVGKAVEFLQEEIEARTHISITKGKAPENAPAFVVGVRGDSVLEGVELSIPDKAEGYAVKVVGGESPRAYLAGHDARGVLFAVGKLLRSMHGSEKSLKLPAELNLSTAPKYEHRGHQLGYRNTANTYDLWDMEAYEQYIRDMVLFGTSSVELIMDGTREERDGRLLAEPQWQRNIKLANLLDSYDLDVWIWYPLHEDVTNSELEKSTLAIREQFFADMPRIDHVFVPGGDPGRTHPTYLMPWLGKFAGVLHARFPNAGLWVSNQKFTDEENDVFFNFLKEHQPDWLAGIALGPGTNHSIQESRKRAPKKFSIRRYPDITHCVRCEFPVPEWDGLFAQTLDREPPNPRPEDTSLIHNTYAPFSAGFVSYSDGAHDDLNKMIWSALAWDPSASVDAILEDYGRVFFGSDVAHDVAMGLRMLESNWRGPIVKNGGIDATLAHWERIGEKGGIRLNENWRYKMYLFRATFDAYIRARARGEQSLQEHAYAALAQAETIGATAAIGNARAILAKADMLLVRNDLRARLEELGIRLFNLIGYQFSIDPPYFARNPERGALLDKADRPLNDRPWLEDVFTRILALESELDRLEKVEELVNWETPGEGSYYDDLGCAWKQPHLVRQAAYQEDPAAYFGPLEAWYRSMDNATRAIPPLKYSWLDQIEMPFGVPLVMRYIDLDPNAKYRVRVTYFGRYGSTLRLDADGQEVHGAVPMPAETWPAEYVLPEGVTKDGSLELTWNLVEGRGIQVAEVWLIRE